MLLNRILYTGFCVLALAGISNCFLGEWLGKGLAPVDSVSGAEAKRLIGEAASSGWGYGLQLYGSRKTKSTKAFESQLYGYDSTPETDFTDVVEQRALANLVARALVDVDPGTKYTAESVKNCRESLTTATIAVAQDRLEAADKDAANCINAGGPDGILEFVKALMTACHTFDGTTGAYSINSGQGNLCQRCIGMPYAEQAGATTTDVGTWDTGVLTYFTTIEGILSAAGIPGLTANGDLTATELATIATALSQDLDGDGDTDSHDGYQVIVGLVYNSWSSGILSTSIGTQNQGPGFNGTAMADRIMQLNGDSTALSNNTSFVSSTIDDVVDGCMDLHSAGVVAKLSQRHCSDKFGEERLHAGLAQTILSSTGIACKLEKTGDFVEFKGLSL